MTTATNKPPAVAPKRETSPRDQQFFGIRNYLTKMQQHIAMALPKHMTPERMVRIALSATSRTPKLLLCTPESILKALIDASEAGLEPNGFHAHLIPYNNFNKALGRKVYEAQFQADYKGYVQLAYRSGLVQSFDAYAVHQDDAFQFQLGSDAYVSHQPSTAEDPGPLTYAYAVCKMRGGGVKFTVLNRRQVMDRKARSRGSDDVDSPWQTNEDAMWAKSAARELFKWIPSSPEMQRVVEVDEPAMAIERPAPLALPNGGYMPQPLPSPMEAPQLEHDGEPDDQQRTSADPTGAGEIPEGHDPMFQVRAADGTYEAALREIASAKNGDHLRALYNLTCGPASDFTEEERSALGRAVTKRQGELAQQAEATVQG